MTKNQRGFGLMQVMLLGAILAAGAFVMTRAITDLKLTQKSAETRDELEILNTNVVAALQDSKHCTSSHTYNVSNSPKQIRLNSGEVLAQEGVTYMNGSIRVDSIVTVVGTPGSITIAYSRLKDNERLKKGFGGKDIKKTFPVHFISPSGVFDRCYLDEGLYNTTSAQEFCESLGSFMRWDVTNKRCVLKSHNCSTTSGTVFVGVDSNGNEICQNITQALTTSNIFRTTPLTCAARTSLGLAIVSGKITPVCNPGGCSPAVPCATIAAGVPCGSPAGSDSCGTNCGVGTQAVAGGWTAWSTWSAWSACPGSTRGRSRTCTSPAPSCGGAVCAGSPSESEPGTCGANKCIWQPGAQVSPNGLCYAQDERWENSSCDVIGDCPPVPFIPIGCEDQTQTLVRCGTLGLANGAPCSTAPGTSGLPDCSFCEQPILNLCGCGFNPSNRGTCNDTTDCDMYGMCW